MVTFGRPLSSRAQHSRTRRRPRPLPRPFARTSPPPLPFRKRCGVQGRPLVASTPTSQVKFLMFFLAFSACLRQERVTPTENARVHVGLGGRGSHAGGRMRDDDGSERGLGLDGVSNRRGREPLLPLESTSAHASAIAQARCLGDLLPAVHGRRRHRARSFGQGRDGDRNEAARVGRDGEPASADRDLR
jgi:hypothetical protein